MNTQLITDAIQALIASGGQVDVARLADPDVALGDLLDGVRGAAS